MTPKNVLTESDSPQGVPRLTWGLRIPLRDGVELCATLYLPAALAQPAPVIIVLTPYIAQTYHRQGLYFARAGYPFLAIDVRGRGNSGGEFKPNIHEAADAGDVVRWVAEQPYCDGRVTMWGGSYSGYAQWAAARASPSPLSTIVPVASPYMGVDFPGRGNIFTPYLMQWLTLIWGRTSQDRLFWNNAEFWGASFRRWFESGAPFSALDSDLGNPSLIFQEWLEHPHADAYWDAYNPSSQEYSRMDLPILTITGAYDGDQPGALKHYREHTAHAPEQARAAHYLVIGPWDHAGTREPQREFCGLHIGDEGLIDMLGLHVEWYDWILRDGERPKLLKDKVSYYVMGADRWRHVASLDVITEQSLPFYLHSNSNPTSLHNAGELLPEPASGIQVSYVHDPRDMSLAKLEASVDPASKTDVRVLAASSGRHLVYHTAPFTQKTEIGGFFRLTAWIAIDRPDTDFKVTVYEVTPSGDSIELTSDVVRARYRTDPRRPVAVEPGEVLRYDFDGFTFIAREIAEGSLIRLVVGPIHSIYSERNGNTGNSVAFESVDEARPVRVTLFQDGNHPSALHIPFAHKTAGR